jgi:hypothetical protein
MVTWEEVLDFNQWFMDNEAGINDLHLAPKITMPLLWHDLRKQVSHTPLLSKSYQLNILDVFIRSLELKATDPRDKLFALLAFGRETSNAASLPVPLQPSYSKSVERVFADFTRWWIREYQSLLILSSTHCHPGRTWRRTLHDHAEPLLSRPTWALGSDG